MYLDGTETHEGTTPPAHCPRCKGKLATRWRPVVMLSRGVGRAVAMPVHVCDRCKVAVRLQRLPNGKLYPTRRAARGGVSVQVASANAARLR